MEIEKSDILFLEEMKVLKSKLKHLSEVEVYISISFIIGLYTYKIWYSNNQKIIRAFFKLRESFVKETERFGVKDAKENSSEYKRWYSFWEAWIDSFKHSEEKSFIINEVLGMIYKNNNNIGKYLPQKKWNE